MTETVIFDCPRCRAMHTTFDVKYRQIIDRNSLIITGVVMGMCRNCDQGIMIDIMITSRTDHRGKSFMHWSGSWWEPSKVYPDPNNSPVSDLLPENVRQVMKEAEEALNAVSPRIARGCFRTVLDVATQHIIQENPNCLEARSSNRPMNLSTRLDFLTAQNLLNPTLKEWAHNVRGITNNDVHTAEPATPQEAQEIAEITRMILNYLFVMPERVRLAKEAADEKRAATEVPS
ncbi:MAG: DUF4145 domain-containing protein [Gluconobacter japonicus]|uniref:DUF4145 domain-containing protein n=1 Tax=Gluconobacter japonicus TaxID=376620 RepID=UPI0039EB9F49